MWKQLWDWVIGRGWKSFKVHARIWTIKGDFGDISDGNEEHAIGNWKKGGPSYKVAKNLVELCSSVLWKVELKSNETGYLVEISKQSVEGSLEPPDCL